MGSAEVRPGRCSKRRAHVEDDPRELQRTKTYLRRRYDGQASKVGNRHRHKRAGNSPRGYLNRAVEGGRAQAREQQRCDNFRGKLMSETPSKTGLKTDSAVIVRAEFLNMLTRDWLGPSGGEDEIVYERSVRDRYLVGTLAPDHKAAASDGKKPEAAAKSDADEEVVDPIDEQGDLAVGGADVGDDGHAEPV